MSIFGSIMHKIFGSSPAAAATAAPDAAAPAADVAAAAAAPAGPPVDVVAVLTGMASQNSQKLNWDKSIVDLMKLLGLDSSLKARQELAKEMNYTGDMNDSAKMNIWLHSQVMHKLAENGGKVSPDLMKKTA